MESLSIELCAFTVAIAVERYPWTDVDARQQWSPERLSEEIANRPFGDDVNLNVNQEALHQGFFLFKKALKSLRHVMVIMGTKKGLSSFLALPERSKGWNIIFVWLHRPESTSRKFWVKFARQLIVS